MTRQPLPPVDHGNPHARLEPVACALRDGGWTQARSGVGASAFGPTQGGYIAVFAEPLDIDWIRERFELPEDVVWRPEHDQLADHTCWVDIYGSGGRHARGQGGSAEGAQTPGAATSRAVVPRDG